MNKKQLTVIVGTLFVLLIVILQTIPRDEQPKENFEPNRVYHFDENNRNNGIKDDEEYEKELEEIEREEALNEEEEQANVNQYYYDFEEEEDQLLDRARRFVDTHQDLVKRWKEPGQNTVPNTKPNSNNLIQNPIEAALNAKDNIKADPNYAKDRLSELLKLANQNNEIENKILGTNNAPTSVQNQQNPQNQPTQPVKDEVAVLTSPVGNFGGKRISETCYVPEGRKSCAPQYIIAGAMKCGTTSMYAYLTSHPKVLPLNPNSKLNGKPVLANKEVRFWLDPTYSSMMKSKGDKDSFFEYLNLFYPIGASDPYFQSSKMEYVDYITGEASPMYICQFGVAQRVYSHLPDVKIIIMLRNPIDRAYSELWFKDSLTKGKVQDSDLQLSKAKYQNCLEYEADLLSYCDVTEYTRPDSDRFPQDLTTCVTAKHNAIRSGKCAEEFQFLCDKYKAIGSCAVNNFKNSLYALQVREWVEYFGRKPNQLLIIKSEDFYAETSHWMEITSKFLGIDNGGAEEFNWDSVTGNAFNIVNPGTVSANGMDIAPSAGGGLKMGATAAENVSQYPDMDDQFREKMAEFFDPINKHLAQLIQKPLFWTVESQKGA